MLLSLAVALLFVTGWCNGVQQQYTTPVPILKQIDRQNEDGSYSYGYEAADGSFKIETKYPTGEVYGKYGYVDDTGKVREVEYGATKLGFQPAGSDINVAPPTPDVTGSNSLLPDGQVDDGQYREDPSVYHKDPRYNGNQVRQPSRVQQHHHSFFENSYSSQAKPAYNPPQASYQQPSYQQPSYQQPSYQQPSYQQPSYQQTTYQQPSYQQPSYQQTSYQHSFQTPQQQQYYQPSYNQPRYNPQPYQFNPSQFATHPSVTNVDYLTGSYSVSYGRRR